MRTAALLALVLAAPSAAAAAPVQTMVVGRSSVLFGARTLAVGGATVTAGGHRCGVPAASGLAVLAAARRVGGPAFRVRQQGGCQGLYVFQVGSDRAGGASGWVYKVDRVSPSTGAGERTPQVRAGARVVWFWCRMRGGSFQRTLEISAGTAA
ncbi:MAG: hypothetical protein JWN32_322, partial [Solirubrobacterales bacterium]|nr:hypothetical protein [Solirubrobacterales bacterium]